MGANKVRLKPPPRKHLHRTSLKHVLFPFCAMFPWNQRRQHWTKLETFFKDLAAINSDSYLDNDTKKFSEILHIYIFVTFLLLKKSIWYLSNILSPLTCLFKIQEHGLLGPATAEQPKTSQHLPTSTAIATWTFPKWYTSCTGKLLPTTSKQTAMLPKKSYGCKHR